MAPFNNINTYRLTYPECCGLANPAAAADLLARACCVDSLTDYTTEMWNILTDIILQEWYGLRLPPSKVPWQGPVYLPDGCRLLYCLDRKYARQAKVDIDHHYFSLNLADDSMSVFGNAGYALEIANDLERELEGLRFLARQVDHFRSLDDYLFIIQDV